MASNLITDCTQTINLECDRLHEINGYIGVSRIAPQVSPAVLGDKITTSRALALALAWSECVLRDPSPSANGNRSPFVVCLGRCSIS